MQVMLAIVALLAGAEGQPNIVVVMADDLGLGDVACYGGTMALTPRLDRMAREGLKFNHYYSASPICSPSRAGLLTGTFPARWRLTSYLQTRAGNAGCGQADFLDPQAPTLPRLLKQAGYATAHIGKWHLGGGRDVVNAPPFAAYGYDHHASTYESPQPHPDITATPWVWSDKDRVKRWDRTSFFVDQTVEFLSKQSTKPGFVFLWLDDPHSPWVPDAEKPRKDTPASLRRVLENMDFQIGRLLDRLDAMPQGKNTLVLFISDNGPRPSYQGKRTMGLRGETLSLYEGGIRVPCLVRWPGVIAPGGVDDSTVLSAVDMLPTLAAAAGAQVPAPPRRRARTQGSPPGSAGPRGMRPLRHW
jgi:arylsulfatase A-like enzyme